MKLAICKQCILRVDGVTGDAVAFCGIDEDGQPANLLQCEGIFIPSILKTIKGGVAGEDGSLEARKRLFDSFERDGIAAECLAEHGAVDRVLLELRYRDLMRLIHLDGVCDRAGCLIFEVQCASVPELKRLVGDVEDGRGVPDSDLASGAFGELEAIGEIELRIVAARARKDIIFGQPLVVEQSTSQCDGLCGRRIIRRNRDGGKAQGRLNVNGNPDGFRRNDRFATSAKQQGSKRDNQKDALFHQPCVGR